MNGWRVTSLLALLLAVSAAAQDAAPPPDARVIRCVLDRRCRSLVVPFGEGLWAAWDASDGTLTEVWHGDVSWDGPVYTTVHGPQPTTRGEDLFDPLAGATWAATVRGTVVPLTASLLSYDAPAEGPVALHWRLTFPGAESVDVTETPERLPADDRSPLRLRRTFRFSAVPAYISIALAASGRPALSLTDAVETDGQYHGKAVDAPPGDTSGQQTANTRLQLNRDAPTHVTVSYTLRPTPAPTPAAPSAPPAAEPPAPPAASPDARRAALLAPPHDLSDTSREQPGVALRVYDLDGPLMRLAPLEQGQTPNVDVVLRDLDLDGDRGDFVALGAPDDNFLAEATTRLRVDVQGEWTFRLTSDDGSRLAVDGRPLIDNDGLHPALGKDGAVALGPGEHDLDVWMFEAGGGELLRLQCKPPGAAEFAPLPADRVAVPAGIVRVTSPGPKRTVKPLPRTRPGDGEWLAGVHPSFTLHAARPPGFEPKVGGLALRGDELLVSTWDRDGAVWSLTGARGDDPAQIHVRRIACGLAEPLGLLFDGHRTFVLQKQELTELIDRDGDGVADVYRCVCNGWPVTPNFHEFAFGLAERDGWLYANLAVAIDPGGRSAMKQAIGRGSSIRIRPDDGRWELIAQGLRTPNGIGYGSDLSWKPGDPPGDRPLYIADNQGDWLPASKVVLVQPGAFYGNRSVLREKADGITDTPPVAWLPQGEIGNSPSQPVPLPVGPWKGQMLVGDVTFGGLQRIAVDRVGNALNGCVFAFTQGLEAGVNRLCWDLDGVASAAQPAADDEARWHDGIGADLFVGGIGSTGNWGQDGKLKFGLQRLRYTGAPSLEMLDVRAMPDGLQVSFTQPLAQGLGFDPDGWFVQSWRYVPTDTYGGPKVDVQDHRVDGVTMAEDGRSLRLSIPDLSVGRIVYVRALDPLQSTSGLELWTHEAWLTLNAIPPGNGPNPIGPPSNTLSLQQRADNWRVLFDGSTTAGWHNHAAPPAAGTWPAVQGWTVKDEALVRTGDGGDLVSDEEFGDFELTLDWRISEGGNSGILFGVDETPRADGSLPAVWETGVEMQVLDDERHADGQNPLTSAGACYALYAPTHDDTRPVGHWNHVRIVKHGAHVEQWLNGRLQCSYDIGSPDWTARVADSKFASMPGFAKSARGHIALQDHGDEVAYRNVFIRTWN